MEQPAGLTRVGRTRSGLLLKFGAVLLAGALCGGPVDAGMLLSAAPAGSGAPVNIAVPQLTGNLATVGNTLNCSQGSWSGTVSSYAYAFYRDGTTNIGSAASYSVTAPDQGHNITCKVTATGTGSTTSPASNPAGSCSQSTPFFVAVWGLPATLDGAIGAASGSANHVADYDTMICAIAADGNWTILDALYIFATAAATGSSTAVANLNLVSPGTKFTAIANGPPAFAANGGYTGADNSSTVYIDTQLNPVTSTGIQWAAGNAHMMTWFLSPGTANPNSRTAMAGYDGTNVNQLIVNGGASPGTDYCWIQRAGGSSLFATSTGAAGDFLCHRAGTGMGFYKNGAVIASDTTTPTATINKNIYILSQNGTSGASAGYAGQISAASLGGPFSNTGNATVANFHTRICAYLTAVHGSC